VGYFAHVVIALLGVIPGTKIEEVMTEMAKKGTKKYPAWFNPKEDYQMFVEMEKMLLSKMEKISDPSLYIRCVNALISLQRTKRIYSKYV